MAVAYRWVKRSRISIKGRHVYDLQQKQKY